ncbi:MAG TPA: serine protease [Bacteroidia bacterium]
MRNVDLFDDYLFGRLNSEDKKQFENRLREDAEFKAEFNKHKGFVDALNYTSAKNTLKAKLKSIHQSQFGSSNIRHINENKTFYQKYIKPTGMAATVAVLAVITTVAVLSGGGYLIKKQNTDYTELKREVNQIKTSQDVITDVISKVAQKKRVYVPANFMGTGFAINSKGYCITSLHLVRGCDSIFIGNNVIDRAGARIVYTDTKLDVAILKIDSAFTPNWKDLPYSFKSSASDLGEKIFTLGYPAQDIVYGEGSISSSTKNGDTNMFQISIPVNPGNSGGPLMDEQGNIVGVVSGKKNNAEGTGFAAKAQYITDVLKNIEDEDLKKELTLSKRNNIKGLKRSEQIKKISPYVFNVYVYKGN